MLWDEKRHERTRERTPERARPRLASLGREYYLEDRLEDAVACYAELAELAKRDRDDAARVDALFWQGAALHGAGRLEQAIHVFERAIDATELTIENGSLYMLITRCVRAMIERPFPLADIERALHQVEDQLRSAGITDRRSRLLAARARLALSRGRLAESLALSEEGLERLRHESLTLTPSSHYWLLVTACTWLGDRARAQRHLAAWQAHPDSSRRSKRVFLAVRRAELERRAGRVERAIALAEEAFGEARESEEYQQRVCAGHALVRALLLAGHCDPARKVLAGLLALRHSEVGEHRHLLRVLRADWHLAHGRRLAGLASIDPESGVERPARATLREPGAAEAALARAERLYAHSLAHGCEIDARLACDFRAREISARLALVERSRGELG